MLYSMYIANTLLFIKNLLVDKLQRFTPYFYSCDNIASKTTSLQKMTWPSKTATKRINMRLHPKVYATAAVQVIVYKYKAD